MQRKIITNDTEARADIGTERTRPDWREGRRSLPFAELSGEEFEVFCYLLLRREFPGETIYYHGKTGDAGHDIVHKRPDGTIRLIQCKRYAKSVGADLIKKELAKLFVNLFNETIPEMPQEVLFYVVPDTTAPGERLLENQAVWKSAAAQCLRSHLKGAAPPTLIKFATTWWPEWGRANGLELTERSNKFSDLRDEFFAVRKVIDASREDVRKDSIEAIKPLREQIDALRLDLASSQQAAPMSEASLHGLVPALASILGIQVPATPNDDTATRTIDAPRRESKASVHLIHLVEAKLVSDLSKALNVPLTSILQAIQPQVPPPLPQGHVPRADIVELMLARLRNRPVLAITGYEECGKTTSLAEFASRQQWDSFWFSTPTPSSVEDSNNAALFLFSLRSFIDADSAATGDMAAALHGRLLNQPLLIVIDNAHLFGDLGPINFLLEIAANQPVRLQIVLGATDSPRFTSLLRAQSISLCRMPGMSLEQACDLYRSMGTELTQLQRTATEFLCVHCDGHVGLLRLAVNTIRSIYDESTLAQVLADIAAGLGKDAAQMHAVLISRFRKSLTDEEFQLCRRLTITLRPFQRRLAHALWSKDLATTDFQQAWNLCVAGIFEAHDGTRFTLPSLYQNGLREYSDSIEITCWHAIAAETLGQPIGSTFNIFDICDSIAHRVLSGDDEAALNHACGFLALAAHGQDRDVSELLLARFNVWLRRIAVDDSVSRSTRIRWHTLRTRICWDVKRHREAHAAADALLSLLNSTSIDVQLEEQTLAWAVLLLHASLAGRPQLAIDSFNALPAHYFDDWGSAAKDGRVFLLLSAFLRAKDNPLSAVHECVCERSKYRVTDAELWNEENGYELWRAVESAIYSAVDRAAQSDRTFSALQVAQVQTVREEATRQNLWNIALILGALQVRLHIDMERNFQKASALAMLLAGSKEAVDERVRAYSRHVLGDALRCGGRLQQAVAAYSSALALWPEQEVFQRAQTTLLLAISSTRNGERQRGYQFAEDAVRLYRAGSLSPQLQVQAMLETAVMAMHANYDHKALRWLIQAHTELVGESPSRPEWAVLAQCAWVLAARSENLSEDTTLPVAGFTLAIRDAIPGADKMLPVAPTLMLARACNALGRPNRALSFFDVAMRIIEDRAVANQTAYLAFDAAKNARNLEKAAEYAMLATAMQRPSDQNPAGGTFDRFLLDHIVGNVISLALNVTEDSGNVDVVETAWKTAAQQPVPESYAGRTLIASLRGIAHALRNATVDSLEEAYQEALRNGGLVVARYLAWFWCFRFHVRHSSSTNEVVHWHWRLCWLSLATGRHDTTFLTAFGEQEKSLWNRFRSVNEEPLIVDICDIFADTRGSYESRMKQATSQLAKYNCETLGAKHLLAEVTDAITFLQDLSPLATLVPNVTAKVLNIMLDPAAAEVQDSMKQALNRLVAAITKSRSSDPSIVEWKAAVTGLAAIGGMLHAQQLSASGFDALRSFEELRSSLSPQAEANWYIWMRHLLGVIDRDQVVFEDVMIKLRSERVAELLCDPNVPPVLKRRLSICSAFARAQLAISQLISANAMMSIQQLGMPLRSSAIFQARNERNQAMQIANEEVAAFDSVEADIRNDTSTKDALWSCCHERGNLRKFIGSLVSIQMDDRDNGEVWLREAAVDFDLAITVAQVEDNPSFCFRSANEGLIIARFCGLEDKQAELQQIYSQARAELRDDPIVQMLENANVSDLLVRGTRNRQAQPSWPTDEEGIQRFVDGIMKATGLSADRRRGVEDDVRKQICIEQIQLEFCKHLQPLQNLEETRSADTAYLFRTKYTCSCTLLGHHTVIENDDIDTVINAMQRTYCDECDRRAPGADNIDDKQDWQ